MGLSETEGEIPFPSHQPCKFPYGRSQGAGCRFPAYGAIGCGQGKELPVPENLHKGSLCKETNCLQLSEHNPWQGSANARWFLGCPSRENLSLNLLRRQKDCGKLFPFLVLCAVSGHLLFSRSLSWCLCVCLETAPRAPQSCPHSTP